MHARLYDESRHVDKFHRDHRPQVLRQTKGGLAAYRNILSNLRGAILYGFITELATRVRHEYVRIVLTPDVGMRVSSLVSIRRVDYREIGVLSRAKWHTEGSVRVVRLHDAFGSFPRSYKADIVNFYCIVRHTWHEAIFFRFCYGF